MRQIFLLIILSTFLWISALTIDNISNISNETIILDYDNYAGAVLRYNNRLLVNSQNKIEDFEILPSGELYRIGFVETNLSLYAFIDEDKLYSVDATSYDHYVEITVYSLEYSPLQEIHRFIVFTNPAQLRSIAFTNNHMMIGDRANERIILVLIFPSCKAL